MEVDPISKEKETIITIAAQIIKPSTNNFLPCKSST
jgi:hypothetical protein